MKRKSMVEGPATTIMASALGLNRASQAMSTAASVARTMTGVNPAMSAAASVARTMTGVNPAVTAAASIAGTVMGVSSGIWALPKFAELAKILEEADAQSRPRIVLQSVVECREEVTEGDLIITVVPAWTAIVELLQKDFSVAYQIDPRKWEEIIAAAYERAGFDEVILTPRSGDKGRDVIATKKGLWSIRILDQVKAYSPGHLVTANDVRALYGTLSMDPHASKGLVTTTSDFAPGCHTDFASLIPTRLELVNGAELQKRLAEIAAGKKV